MKRKSTSLKYEPASEQSRVEDVNPGVDAAESVPVSSGLAFREELNDPHCVMRLLLQRKKERA